MGPEGTQITKVCTNVHTCMYICHLAPPPPPDLATLVYLTRDYYGGEKVAVWPKSAIFSRSIIFPATIKPADSAFRVSGGMGHDTLHVTFNMFNKQI